MTECIEACVSNIDSEVRNRLEKLDTSTVVAPCLEHCGRCYREPLLVVDGELITGDSHAELLKRCYR
ncbi:DUF1450 domain-containing protein [Haloarcula nitratireducens]|uniref:DUF1450 domain-containing protein n=1 Tax=Haloarcula nitratireducens TaxID=2487749 RepID=A0AAW4PG19_9EURY|nr:DUF1450 domain-containing protein [Halomicroarcula nitratireducens]